MISSYSRSYNCNYFDYFFCKDSGAPREDNWKVSVLVKGGWGSREEFGTVSDKTRAKDIKILKFLSYIYLNMLYIGKS